MSGIEFLDEVADRPADQTARGSRRWWLLGGLVLALVIIWALIRPVEHPRSMPEAVPTHVPLATASPLATATPLAPEEDLCRQEPICASPGIDHRAVLPDQEHLRRCDLSGGATHRHGRRPGDRRHPDTPRRPSQPPPAPTTYHSVRCGTDSRARRSLRIRGQSSVPGTTERLAVGGAAARARGRARAGVSLDDHPRKVDACNERRRRLLAEAGAEAADHLSATDDVQQQDGQRRQEHRRENRWDVHAVLALERPQGQRQGAFVRSLSEDEG